MAYGLKYYHQFNDRGDYLHRIEILGKDFSGSAELITTSTGDPVIRRHSGDKTKKKIIQGKELQFSFYCFPGDVNKYDEIFESDYKDYKIRYYVAGPLVFEGWLMPENLSRELFRDKYIINLSATDGLARLRDVEFRDTNDKIIEGKLSLLETIKYAVSKIGIEFDFRIQLGTYEKDWMTASQCALDKIEADARRFIKKDGNPLSCYEVIENCLKCFSCTLKQHEGYYQITNKHEANSYQFVFDWSTLTQQSRTATNKIVDLSGCFYEKSELNKISPLKDVGITFRNRSLGTTISTDNLDDWAGSWNHTFDTMSESGGEVKLNSGATWEGDYIELKNDFAVTKDTNHDYIQVSFDHDVERIVIGHCWPGMRVLMKKPPHGTYLSESPWIPCDVNWKHYDSGIIAQFRVYEAGDYNIRIIFNRYAGIDYGTYDFYLKNVKITKVVNTNVTDPVDVPLIAMDEYYIQTLAKNVIKLEYETLLADGLQGNQIGSFFYNNSGTYENTSSWNSYGHTENIPILDIWARNELNDRYRYKNYLKLVVHDKENAINMDSILSIDSKHYTIVSYSRNEKKCIVTCDIVELLTTYQSYDQIYNYYLGSVDDAIGYSPPTESSQEHNELPGLQGGVADQYYHFYETEYTELHNWLNNVVLSDVGGIDMDDELKVNTINEHTLNNGIDAEGVHLEDGGITLGTGPAVDTIETTLTNDDTHLPTSGAVYDAIAGASPSAHASTHENGGSDEISVAGLSGLLGDAQTPLAHVLDSATHTISGKTPGHFLKALTATTFGFAAHGLSYGDVGAAAASHTHPWSDITGKPTTLAGYGISDTMANFDTACSDGNFAFAGGAYHDGFSDFVSNEHINHISVSIGAGTGLSGGGDITATRTIDLDLSDCLAISGLSDSDIFGVYDSVDGQRNITYANFKTALSSDLSVIDMTNGSDNRVTTAVDADTINAEANLTFDGTILDVNNTLQVNTINEHTADAGIIFEGIKAIDNYLEFLEIAAPAAPDATHGRLFVDTSDGLIKFKNNSTTYDLTEVGGGAQISGTPTGDHLTRWVNATTIADVDGLTWVDAFNYLTVLSGRVNFDDSDVGIYRSGGNLTFRDTSNSAISLSTLKNEVSISGTPVNNQLAVWTNASTIEGATYLTYSAGTLTVRYINPEITSSYTLGSNSFYWSRLFTDYVHFIDSATYIWKDASNNLYFNDAVTGGKTLAQLAAGGITWDNGGSNRVGTYVDADTINAEENLTFSGTKLTITGNQEINQGVHAVNALKINLDVPSVVSDTSNSDISINIDNRYAYDIAATKTDSGYRMGLNVAAYSDDASLLGTLAAQYGIRVQYGHYGSSGSGTITTAYGLYLDCLTSGSSTITTAYSIYSAGIARMYHAGKVGIGTLPSSSYELKVGGSIYADDMGIAGETSTDAPFKSYGTTVQKYAASFMHDGNTALRYGIKIQCGEDDQSQGGSQAFYIRFFDGDGQSEGNIVVDAGTLGFVQASDARRKTNIEDVSLDVNKILSNIQVREFDMLQKDGKTAGGHQIGWVAQEVMKAYAPMASYDKDTDLFGIKPAVIVPLLHRGWQLHEERLETHQEKIIRLERRVKYLENKHKKS